MEAVVAENAKAGAGRQTDEHGELEGEHEELGEGAVQSEQYLRDVNGKIVKDKETGEARRIDEVVIDGRLGKGKARAVDAVEVRSKTADKTKQEAKEGES